MYIGRYWGYLDVQVLVVCLSLMPFLFLKLISESQFIRLPLDYHFLLISGFAQLSNLGLCED